MKCDFISEYLYIQAELWLSESNKDSSKFFFYKKHIALSSKVVLQNMECSFDVSASGFQIFAVLVGDETFLLNTNFFVLPSSNNKKKSIFRNF